MNTVVEFYGVKIDSRCEAFLNIAIIVENQLD